METKVLYNPNMHFEHQLWKRELAFWEEELIAFNFRLSELITRWTTKEVLAKWNFCQSEFIIHGSVIEELLETIEIHEIYIATENKKGDKPLNNQLAKKHFEIRAKLENQREVYAQLKKDFFKFLTESM